LLEYHCFTILECPGFYREMTNLNQVRQNPTEPEKSPRELAFHIIDYKVETRGQKSNHLLEDLVDILSYSKTYANVSL